ncbi:ferritin-like domain-containing protein [Conexibacter stalactiti]|uniref:Ferritin-like domain-containing protein n=1 Tax=Conexibacter stalactiti TaxID=1940611 RepID=A0ABU4HT59_9ACTN|nr:ferritin-like domain-containing protein [Conexibacter stalactiti]MDW5596458.1 ferritin-like domain-containing protein [Conexibacter stalactiti]MEC5037100.1 ferritin-like domain-containing protein [Conexibacter stalactiti]
MKPQLTDLISLETLDRDGALREQEEAVAGDTRADLFRKAGIAGGSLIASGVLFGGLPALASAAKPSKKQDVAILNYALTLEYLEAAFYKEALRAGFPGALGEFARLVAADEAAHVAVLKRVLGSAAVKSPSFDFGDTTSDEARFRATAFALETTGVAAYSGQATNIKQVPIIRAAVSILTIEARHAGAIAALNGDITGRSGVTPNGAFDVAYSMKRVLSIVRGTGFITG